MLSITIDGVKYSAEPGGSVLDVARANNIWIPTLCHHPSLSDYGACRLCQVEVVRGGRSRVTAACTLPASNGQEIVTRSERLARLRRLVMELILASCPNSKAVLELAEKLGAKPGRLATQADNDCLLCGMCVRACREISRTEAISFASRGIRRKVGTPFDESSRQCVLCGACLFVCPTGSRVLTLARIAGEEPRALLSRFDADLRGATAIARMFPQAVPNVPAINPAACLKLNRDACGICEKVCQAKAIRYDDRDRQRVIKVGAVVAVPGFESFAPEHDYGLGYTSNPDVVTSMEFERILSASGPFGGHVVRPSDGREPRRIAFLQCVGSRDISCRNEFCSAVCCMYAVKEAIIAKEHARTVEPTIFFMDIRAHGKDFDKFVERAKTEYGVRFRYARVAETIRNRQTGQTEVVFADEAGQVRREPYDLVVLAVGLEHPEGIQDLARGLGVRLDQFGFIATDPLRPLATSRAGIFAGGAASGPKDIPETVVQASAAACEAERLLASARHTLVTAISYPAERDVAGEQPRIGVFVCHCGINIGGVVNVPQVRAYAATLPDVIYADANLYTCSQDTQKLIKERIAEHRLNRVVVASCSPRTHERLFQATMREAGLNPHLFEMANIRDHCSWIHMHAPEAATQKACDLVRMAVAKARLAEPLLPIPIAITQKALVIGGGVAGMACALGIADQGYEVVLVEKTGRLGGNALNLTALPDGRNPAEWAADLAERVRRHQRIRVLLPARVAAVKGCLGNYETTVECKRGATTARQTVKHGVAVLAVGAQESKPEEYAYGRHPGVMTQLELERKLAAPAPKIPATVVMIQCVGSREEKHMYCSRVCCTTAVKNAIRIKQASPQTAVYILYRDLRTYGLREYYYRQARDLGVQFLRFDLAAKPAVKIAGGKLKVTTPDALLAAQLEIPADWLILSTRMEANPDNEELGQLFKVPLNSERFFLEAHVKLRPVDFATDGVFMAGTAHNPKSLDESIGQAYAAAARACTIISNREMEAEPVIAAVNEELCDGCGLCVPVCDYNALEIVVVQRDGQEKKQVKVKEALCKGCGGCAAACPSGAMEQKGYKSLQILAMIDAALEEAASGRR